MKRILIIIASAVCLCLNAKAQVFLGGEMSKYNLNNTEIRKYYSFIPSIGYQYNRLAFGMDFSYRKINSNYNNKDKAIELYPFVRYYYFKKNNLSLFIEAVFSYSIHKTDFNTFSYNHIERYHAFSFVPGIQYNLTPHLTAVAFLGTIGYSDSYWYGFKDFGCSFGLGATSLSFYYYFGNSSE